jgi:hypothetical protein
MFKVAALYVDPKGPYGELCTEVFDMSRNALTYETSSAKGLPVLAHPPCGPWGHLSWACTQQDPALGHHAIHMVRKYGGIVEHPVGSKLFEACGIPTGDWDNPEREFDAYGGYTIRAKQFDFGHWGQKDTIFYIVGIEEFPHLLERNNDIEEKVQNLSKLRRRLTPRVMARWLADAASTAMSGDAWRSHLGLDPVDMNSPIPTKRDWITGIWWKVNEHPKDHPWMYEHLVRCPYDDQRLSREERLERYGSEEIRGWREARHRGSIVEWERKTLDLMSDGECRTFNQICLDLTDRELTAEFFHRSVLERSIWSLVASHKLEHTTSAPIYFSAT